ncbi:unnamed protein product, partial [Rotaria sp. Silwood1]
WEKDGFKVADTETWNKLRHDQRQIACDIWHVIEEHAGKTIRFEQLIAETNRKMQMILTIKENITSCINNYCQEACDKKFYDNLLKKMGTYRHEEKVHSIEVPKEIEKLKPFADRLNPVFSSHVWQSVLKHDSDFQKLKDNAVNNGQEITCLMLLLQVTKILDQFISRLKVLYTDTKQPLFPQLEQLFPEKNFIDHEFNIFEALVDDNIASYLKKLVEYWKNYEHINHICRGCIHLSKHYNIPLTEQQSILQNILDINNQSSIETCKAVYQAYCAHYEEKYNKSVLKLIAQWSLSEKLIDFSYSLTVTDVDNLLEIVNDWDETLISTKTVLDFVLLKRFHHQTDIMIDSIRQKRYLEFNDIINCFEEVSNEIEFKNILNNYESCSKCLFSIDRICMGSKNKEQSKRRRILDIMKNSSLCFCVHQLRETVHGNQYQFDVHIMNTNWEPICFDDLSELRDRARLIQYGSNKFSNLETYTDDNIQQLQSFVSFVETLEIILENLKLLNIAGYPFMQEYPMSKRKFTCRDDNYHELDKFKLSLTAQLSDWEQQLCIMYETCIDLTYFSYQQIWLVENSLYKQTVTSSNDPGYHLLKFIGIDPQNIQLELLPMRSITPNDRLKNMAQILNSQRVSKYFSIQENDQNHKQVFLVETSNKEILRAIYSLFHLNNIPIIANQLFYCTMNTDWIEIRAFVYRCFYSQTLHQLIRPELLSLVIQDKFAQLLNQLIKQNPKHFFLLSMITTVSISQLHIINSLRIHRMMKIIRDQDILSEEKLLNIIQPIINDYSLLVTSTIAGLGKSTYIRNESLQLNKKCIKFPISGDVDIDTLVERLYNKEIQLESSTIVIHIDISAVEDVQQLNEFLYCFVLFRCFRLRQIPIHVSSNIPIYIELDSSLYLANLKDDIIIFKYMKIKHIDCMNWNELNVNNSSPIQFVANYLQSIENEKIIIENITEENKETFDQLTCIRLLQKYFFPKKNIKFVSWTQLSIFVSIYYKLFSGFSQCGHFFVDPEHHSSLRTDILRSLLNSSDQFTSLSVETVRKNQRSMHDDQTIIPFSEAIIRWDTIQPFTVIFTTTNDPLFVYKTKSDIPSSLVDAFRLYYQLINENRAKTNVPQQTFYSFFYNLFANDNAEVIASSIKPVEQQLQEFLTDHDTMTHEQFFLRLTLLSTKYFTEKSICENCFKQYEYTEKQCTVCSTKNILIRPNSLKNPKDIEDFQKKMAKKLESEYIITADNYIKMLLIYLRVQSGLPVLIMGETGCGKTALIQFLCQKILDDEMVVFHIHAGITNDKINETMHELLRKAQKCSEENQNKRLWVFLDEFNTTPNIGLLKEIVCEKSFLGKTLPKNMVLLGACNPQRRKKNQKETDDAIGIKKHHYEILRQRNSLNSSSLYSVVTIPETMLEYIWDYGYLNEITEKSYVQAIVNACENLTTDQTWLNCILTLIIESHKFYREYEDVSSVSLRDVVRFCRFYNWFYKFPISNEDNQVLITFFINKIEHASLIALFLCYYFRLNSPIKRQEYLNKMENSIKNFKPNIPCDSLNKILQNEKMSLIKRMELPIGTAINRALTDNIFVLFTCILNRIPVILCGKPGSSKTLAVQIVISNLKGKKSNDSFFQTLDELIAVSYQGSQNCTSESVIQVFTRADRYIEANSDIKLLPVIVFDEIGLAELSPHNPLKVLHSELEIEKCRHGFIGLSNWRLDASKMNRAIYLCCPEPDLDDLKMTAIALSQSMLSNDNQAIPLDNFIVEGLANSYMEMCNHLKQHRNQYYFGLRDYYSLIRGIVNDMLDKKLERHNLHEIIRYQLAINFDGIINGAKFMWSKFCEYIQQNHLVERYSSPTFDQLINQSMSFRTGRFLMLIGDSESSFDYIQQYINIKYRLIKTHTLIGSTFAGDFLSNTIYTEQYNTRILMDIILYAEKNITLFIQGLGHLYDNLYDLFNQNFSISARKKYCRIALGSLYHPRCIIHDNFFCVVFIKKHDLDKYDPPFLNRFEKHFIDMDTLINEYQKSIVSILNKWINEFLLNKPNHNFPCKKNLFIEFSNDYIINLITDAYNHLSIPINQESKYIENIIKYCQDQMIRTSSFDFPLLLSLRSQKDHTNNVNDFIQRYYEIHADLSFSSFINQILEKEKIPKLLIYTYTQIHEIINYNDIKNYHMWLEEIKLSYFKTELELKQKITMFYQMKYLRLLFIRVDYHQEHEHISMLKHILLTENIIDENRGICFIFHLQRNMLNQINNDVFFNGWSTIMIDNLQEHKIIPLNILMNPSYHDLIIHLDFLNFETIFDDLIKRCFNKFRYHVKNKQFEDKINQRRESIIQQLTLQIAKNDNDDLSLRSLIKKQLLKIFENIQYNSNQSQSNDWRQDLLTKEIIIGSCCSFNDALIKIIMFFLDNYLSLLIAHLEKHSLIDSYVFLNNSNEEINKKLCPIWFDCWIKITKTIDISSINQTNIEIPLIFDLHLPCAINEYEIIRQIRMNIAQYYQNNNENITDIAWKELINRSIYGEFIKEILNDSNLFDHYYHDQLTLARNEANIHQLSTLYVQRLLTSKIAGTIKYRLRHLLIDYEDLFEIMRLFEISIPLISDEDHVFEILNQQFIILNDNQEKIIRNISDLYYLVIDKTNIYQIPPKSTSESRLQLNDESNPFIETCLMNLIELLVSPTIIDRIDNMKQLLTIYGRLIQSIYILSHYNHYEIINVEKFHSLFHLASCISDLFPIDQSLIVFKKVYCYSNFHISFEKLDQIDNFISYLNNVIHQQQSTANDTIIHQNLIKFENELVRNWFIENNDKCGDILKFIHDHDRDLWKYSTKIFMIINGCLELSSTIKIHNGRIPQNNEYTKINQYLCKLNDSTRKIEVLLTTRIYTQLILNENYESLFNQDNRQQWITILTHDFDHFKKNLNEIEHITTDEKLKLIGLIAWLQCYIQYYVYVFKHDENNKIIQDINNIFIQDDFKFYSTLKLFIIKQLCQLYNVTFHNLCSKFASRNVDWINSMITQPFNQRTQDVRHYVILPTPLFESCKEFKRIDDILSSKPSSDQLRDLIKECATKRVSSYCFIIWFVHHYARFYMENILPDTQIVNLIQDNVKEELINYFEPIGYQLIISLCTNFNDKSYFQLKPFMSEENLHLRLIVLNIIALLISFKSIDKISLFGFLLYDGNKKMPTNYTEHFKMFNSLTGVAIANDYARIQMMNIRTQIDEQIKNNKIDEPDHYIIRCSSNCLWMFYFNNCDRSNEQRSCPLCKNEIIISNNNDFNVINSSHIRMNINEALEFISKYIDLETQNDCSNIIKKCDHLKQPLTSEFINFFTHAIFLFLNELNLIPNSTTTTHCVYFQESIKKYYGLLRTHLSNIDQCYIWLYKLINHMLQKTFVVKGYLNRREKVIELEKLIEEKLILPHIKSVINEIKEYKTAYVDFVYGDNKNFIFANFVDEIIEDNEKYPLLNFFNVTNIHTVDFIDDFYTKLQLLPDFENTYPLITFLLKRLSDYDNIQYLYPIIKFTNYFIENLNHRIKRNVASKTTITRELRSNR